MNNRSSVVWPVLLITAGILFLLNNLGVVTVNLWHLVSNYWPIIFIIAGVDLLFFKRGSVGSYIGVIIIVAVIGFSAWASDKFDNRVSFGEQVEVQISHDIDEIEEVDMYIDMNVGELNIESLDTENVLIAGTISVGEHEQVTNSLTIDGDSARYNLSTSGFESFNSFDFDMFDDGVELSWDLGITETLPVDLRVDSGVSDTTIDLSNIILTDFDYDGGVGEATITFPAEGDFDATIQIGVGSVTVYVPESLSVKIVSSIGIGDVSVRGDYMVDGSGRFVSSDYDKADGVTIYVDGGIGDLEIIQIP